MPDILAFGKPFIQPQQEGSVSESERPLAGVTSFV